MMDAASFSKLRSGAVPPTLNTFIFRHIVRDDAATECVDSGIGFFHGHAIEDYAYGCFREALWTTFGGHEKKIERGTDTSLRTNRSESF
jgi:hypothetical protein